MTAAAVEAALRAAREGDRKALARLLSALEDQGPAAALVTAAVDRQLGLRPPVLGITGPPGVGKSTLTNALVGVALREGGPIAVLAIDPSSPISGGALLGDRIRMAARDRRQVFIRSFANRGYVGGLSAVIPSAIGVVAAAGFSTIIVETVGVGQSELDIASQADVTVVVLSPQSGDATQAAKAGLMEIGDLIVLNKAELPGAATALADLRAMVRLRQDPARRVPVLKVSAAGGSGVEELWATAHQVLEERRRGAGRRSAADRRLDELARRLAAAVRKVGERGFNDGHPFGRAARGEVSIGHAVDWALARLQSEARP